MMLMILLSLQQNLHIKVIATSLHGVKHAAQQLFKS